MRKEREEEIVRERTKNLVALIEKLLCLSIKICDENSVKKIVYAFEILK